MNASPAAPADIPVRTMSAGAGSAAHRFDAEIVDTYFRSARIGVVNGVMPLLFMAAAYRSVPQRWILAWGAIMLIVCLGRLALRRAYLSANPPAHDAPHWMRLANIGVLVSGIAWGLPNLVFLLPDAQPVHWLLGIALIGLISSAAVTIAALQPLLYIYIGLIVVPYLAGAVLQADPVSHAAAGILLAFTVLRVISARQYRRGLEDTFRLRYDNAALVDALRARTHEARLARDRAEAAALSKSKYLAAASHDLRQPVHALGLFMEELRHQPPGAPAPRALARNMSSAVESLDALLGAVLDISRLDAGIVKPKLADICLDPVLEGVVTQHRSAAQAKGLALRRVPCSAWVRTDPALLMSIVGNFVSNAVRYTTRGRVLVGCRRLAHGVRIEVWDTGRGIPATEHAAIFREFHRLDAAAHDGGLGLGLAIAERTAKLLKHSLSMQSVPGRGSVFRIDVPYGEKAPRAEPVAVIDQREPDLRGFVVAVVDDEPAILAAMRGLLRRWGCEVIAAGSADELLAACAQLESIPDAMLIDYQLADDALGTDVIARVEQTLRIRVPCTLITGNLQREQLDAFEAAGLHVLHKPVRPAQLRQCLVDMLGHTAPRRR